MAEKLFIVTEAAGHQRLIQAKNAQAAIQFAIGAQYTCKQAKATDIVPLMDAGIRVEVAVDEKAIAKSTPQGPTAETQPNCAPNTHSNTEQISPQPADAGIFN